MIHQCLKLELHGLGVARAWSSTGLKRFDRLVAFRVGLPIFVPMPPGLWFDSLWLHSMSRAARLMAFVIPRALAGAFARRLLLSGNKLQH